MNPKDTMPHFDSYDSEWIAWYKSLRAFGYSQKEANEIFISAFYVRADQNRANTNRLREFAKTQKFTIEGGYLGSAVDAVSDTGKGFGAMFRSFSFFIVLAVLLGVIVIGFVVYNTIKD